MGHVGPLPALPHAGGHNSSFPGWHYHQPATWNRQAVPVLPVLPRSRSGPARWIQAARPCVSRSRSLDLPPARVVSPCGVSFHRPWTVNPRLSRLMDSVGPQSLAPEVPWEGRRCPSTLRWTCRQVYVPLHFPLASVKYVFHWTDAPQD
jgi:hypothetical protein